MTEIFGIGEERTPIKGMSELRDSASFFLVSLQHIKCMERLNGFFKITVCCSVNGDGSYNKWICRQCIRL